jgi:DNA polymerase-3 subunit alpha
MNYYSIYTLLYHSLTFSSKRLQNHLIYALSFAIIYFMSDSSFIHLHNRSEFSLLSSALRINDIAKLAAENDMPAVALTDRMNLHACMRFYDACMRNGVRPIIGSEIAVEPFSQQISVDPLSPAVYDIVILAENNKGYEKLCELITRIQIEGNERVLFAKKEWIKELAGDWIILS